MLFSLFHFIGEFGDYFSFDIFMIRFLAGIALGILYCFRGFGITAWTHSLYDLIVLTRITTPMKNKLIRFLIMHKNNMAFH